MTARIGIDLGKTSCRARLFVDGGAVEARGAGAPGLADPDGVAAAFTAVTDVLRELPTATIDAVGIGAAGALADAAATVRFAARVRDAVGVPVAVTSDVIAAHAGAFAGEDGVLLIVGTGAVAFALVDGRLVRADGWGPWLGDEGSGQWIGRRGLQAALRAHDGRGAQTALTASALALVPSLDALPRWLADGPAPAARLAQFAPVVLDAAGSDAVAESILVDAAEALAATAAATSATTVVLHGGITEHTLMRERLERALAAHGLRITAAQADACTGAAALAAPGLPQYEEGITRA